jgi:hypothetical protein
LESRRGMQSFQLAPGRNGIGFWSAPAWAVFASFRPRGRELPADRTGGKSAYSSTSPMPASSSSPLMPSASRSSSGSGALPSRPGLCEAVEVGEIAQARQSPQPQEGRGRNIGMGSARLRAARTGRDQAVPFLAGAVAYFQPISRAGLGDILCRNISRDVIAALRSAGLARKGTAC